MSNKQFLTKEGYENLVHELQKLKEEDLPRVIGRLKDSLGQGDISENAEYDTAILEKDLTEARITELEKLLKDVEIINEKDLKGSKEVRYGSKVLVQLENGKQYRLTIVWSGEVDVSSELLELSFESPLGEAIKGKKVGDIVKVKANKGKYDATIIEIK